MTRFLVPVLALLLATPAAAQGSSPAETADELYARLAKTTDADEAAGVVMALEALGLRAGSDTDTLLASRAEAASTKEDYSLAQSLLDTVVSVDPDWVEGWDLRAAARSASGDLDGAAADIAQTLKREPRHIGALFALGQIFAASGQPENAMKVYQRALQLAPAYQPLVDAAAALRRKLAGQPT